MSRKSTNQTKEKKFYLSIRQPWAGAIFTLEKDIENRSWRTNYKGKLYIHASKSKETLREGYDILDWVLDKKLNRKAQLDFGAIIGSVEIVGCVQSHHSKWFAGKYGLVLKNAKILKTPIIFSASMGIKEIPKDISDEVDIIES